MAIGILDFCEVLTSEVNGVRLELPFSASTARTVLAACDAPDGIAAEEKWRSALEDDPAFCLWVAIGLAPTDRPPSGLRDLAGRLTESWHRLDWSNPADAPVDFERNVERHEQWCRIRQRARRVAERVEDLLPEERDRLRLWALLHVADRWNAADGGLSIAWPAWLRRLLSALADAESQGHEKELSLLSEAIADCSSGFDADEDSEFTETADSLPALSIMARLAAGQLLREEFELRLRDAKLAAMKELAYGASHEINNPLANISTRAQTLLRDEVEPERRRKLATINSQAFRAHEMISDMMLFAKPPRLRLEAVDLQAMIVRVFQELAPDAELQGTELSYTVVDNLEVQADPVHLAMSFKAVCVNALEALGSAGRIHVRLERAVDPLGNRLARITVADTGPGMTEREKQHLFDPFFCGREAGRGLGFGLSKCWSVVTKHGGRVTGDSDDSGSTFEILLPVGGPGDESVRRAS